MGPLNNTSGAKKGKQANEARYRFMTDLIERAKRRAEKRLDDEKQSDEITYVDLRGA